MAGGKTWTAPLTAMVAERRGRSWRMTLRMASLVRFCVSRATARAVNTMVRCASIASRLRTNMGRAARSVLLILKDCHTRLLPGVVTLAQLTGAPGLMGFLYRQAAH